MITKNQILNGKILLVDDMQTNIFLMEKILKKEGYKNIYSTTDARKVIDMYIDIQPDIILLDLIMPHINGFKVIEKLKEIEGEDYLPILVLTADDDINNKLKALRLGARDFLGKPFNKVEALNRIYNILEVKLLYNEVKLQNINLETKVRKRTRDLEKAQIEIAKRLGIACEFRDNDTGGHIERVGRYAEIIGSVMGMDASYTEMLLNAAPLHDIGKIGIPDKILLKPGKLSEKEWEIMKTHTVIGAEILSGGKSEFINMAKKISYSHHERWDGNGYPEGLKGEEIPIEGRIVAICDFFDAVSFKRPYKEAWEINDVVQAIIKSRGTHFDPKVVDVFIQELELFIKIIKEYKK